MAWQIGRRDAAFFAVFGLHLIIADAIRTAAEQERIFRERYVTAGNIRGRRVYDTRMWNGVRWYRISAAGTVAVPGTSNHQIQGNYAAVDFWDTGNDPGVSRAGTARANWLRANAPRFDFEPEGYGFNEAWHYRARNIFNTPPAAPAAGDGNAPPVSEEDDDMQSIAINGKQYGLKDQFITHYGGAGAESQADITRKVMSAADELHNLNKAYPKDTVAKLGDLLDGLGIPRNVLDANGFVLNPQSGKYENNGTWSREREILAEQAKISTKLDKLLKASGA